MILVVDIGNTKTKIGIYDRKNKEIKETFTIRTKMYSTKDEILITIQNLFLVRSIPFENIVGASYSSVVPKINKEFLGALGFLFGENIVVVGPGIKTGIKIKTDNPKEVGTDIVVDAIEGAYSLNESCVICNLGTAIKVFYINKEKELEGVVIAPGFEISLEALSSKASNLGSIDFSMTHNVKGKNTVEAIKGGMYYGFGGLIKELIFRVKKEWDEDAKVILTGGNGELFEGYLRNYIDIYDKDLTLKGLGRIYEKNTN